MIVMIMIIINSQCIAELVLYVVTSFGTAANQQLLAN